MAPKPITFNESSLPVAKADLKPNARHSETPKTAADEHQVPNGRTRKSIVDRIAANSNASSLPPASGIKSRINDQLKPSTVAVSPSAKTDTSNSHQPRENQPWLNTMKRPSSDVPQARSSISHVEDRKRQKSDQYPPAAGSAGRPLPTQQLQISQPEGAKPRGHANRTGVSQAHGPGRGARQPSAREDSAMHVLESGVKVTRAQQRSSSQKNIFRQEAEQRVSGVRTGMVSDALGPAVMGGMAWNTVVEQLREKAVQETDRALADASDHLKTLLVEKVSKLADLCGFVAEFSRHHSGEVVATFKHASALKSVVQHVPLEVPDSPSAAGVSDQSPRAHSGLNEDAATASPQNSHSPRGGSILERIQQAHPRQDKRAAVPLSARIEHGHEAPMSFHRRGERETPPLPVTGREDSPDDVEEVQREPSGVEVAGGNQRLQTTQGPTNRDKMRLPSPPRGGRHLPMHPPAGRRRDDRGPPAGVRVPPEVYATEVGPPRGPMGGRGWTREPIRRGGRGQDHRGGYNHEQLRRNQRR